MYECAIQINEKLINRKKMLFFTFKYIFTMYIYLCNGCHIKGTLVQLRISGNAISPKKLQSYENVS